MKVMFPYLTNIYIDAILFRLVDLGGRNGEAGIEKS